VVGDEDGEVEVEDAGGRDGEAEAGEEEDGLVGGVLEEAGEMVVASEA
jgi:hypothetical protein